MPKQNLPQERKWYAIHTYAGYEEIVAQNLKQRIEAFSMEDKIFNVLVPKEKKIKILKGGKKEIVEEKIYPGYILVEMIVTDDSWYVVRNTPRVTGFIGSGTTPIPLSDEEVKRLKERMELKEPEFKIKLRKGDRVKILSGSFKDMEGKVAEVDEERGKVKVLVELFGRETPIEIDASAVKRI